MAPYRSLFDLRGCSGPAVKYALELGMDPNRMLSKGQTNLFGAAKRGDVEKVKVGRIWFHSACFWNNKQLGGGPWIHCRHQRIVFDCWLNIKHLILIDSDFGRGWVYVTNKVSLPSFQKWFAVALPRFGLASLVISYLRPTTWISTIETNMDKHASQLQLTRATRVGRQSIRDMWPRVSVCRTCQNVYFLT